MQVLRCDGTEDHRPEAGFQRTLISDTPEQQPLGDMGASEGGCPHSPPSSAPLEELSLPMKFTLVKKEKKSGCTRQPSVRVPLPIAVGTFEWLWMLLGLSIVAFRRLLPLFLAFQFCTSLIASKGYQPANRRASAASWSR